MATSAAPSSGVLGTSVQPCVASSARQSPNVSRPLTVERMNRTIASAPAAAT
jgi:hypothetical protein